MCIFPWAQTFYPSATGGSAAAVHITKHCRCGIRALLRLQLQSFNFWAWAHLELSRCIPALLSSELRRATTDAVSDDNRCCEQQAAITAATTVHSMEFHATMSTSYAVNPSNVESWGCPWREKPAVAEVDATRRTTTSSSTTIMQSSQVQSLALTFSVPGKECSQRRTSSWSTSTTRRTTVANCSGRHSHHSHGSSRAWKRFRKTSEDSVSSSRGWIGT